MNRPTCKTCAYFNKRMKDRGSCQRYAPPPIAQVWQPNHTAIEDGFLSPQWRVTYTNQWCGEHPEFSKYIEHRKSLEGGDE